MRPTRERADFTNAPRRSQPRAQRENTPKPPPPSHIDLRIIRKANFENFPSLMPAWHEYVDDIGSRNHAVGRAWAIGTLAITYVGSKQMNHMLREAYPGDYHRQDTKTKLFRRVHNGTTNFLREQSRHETMVKAEQLTLSHEKKALVLQSPAIDPTLAAEQALRLLQTPYNLGVFATNGLTPFHNGRRWGVDLSLDKELYEEQRGIMNYLRREEGLDTAITGAGWTPHATLFEVHSHLPVVSLRHGLPLPVEIAFCAPDAEKLELRNLDTGARPS